MDLTEKMLEHQTIFQGRIMTIQVDKVRLPNGKEAGREVCRHPGGVAVLPLAQDGTVTLVRQYRYPIARLLLELPAGKLERGEDPFPAAQRELSEETGFTAGEWTDLGSMYSSPGFCDEKLYLYLARDLTGASSHPDEDEFLDTVVMPFDELLERVLSGEIDDAKTVAAALKTKLLLEREKK